MAQKSVLENACLNSRLFAFVGNVGNYAGKPTTTVVRIYSSDDAPIGPNCGEPDESLALFVGTQTKAVTFASVRAAKYLLKRSKEYATAGDEYNAQAATRIALRYAQRGGITLEAT